MMFGKYLLAGVLALMLLAGLGAALYPLFGEPPALPKGLESTILPKARPLTDFELRDQYGEVLNLERLRGKWTLLFFGYTHCPDICPTTLATLRSAYLELEKNPDDVKDTQVVFVSVDPKRDTPEQLRSYMAYFHPAFLAAAGSKAQIDALAMQVGAVYMFDGDTSGDDYIVNHSAAILLIDPKGRFYGRFSAPHAPKEIADAFRRTRDFYGD